MNSLKVSTDLNQRDSSANLELTNNDIFKIENQVDESSIYPIEEEEFLQPLETGKK